MFKGSNAFALLKKTHPRKLFSKRNYIPDPTRNPTRNLPDTTRNRAHVPNPTRNPSQNVGDLTRNRAHVPDPTRNPSQNVGDPTRNPLQGLDPTQNPTTVRGLRDPTRNLPDPTSAQRPKRALPNGRDGAAYPEKGSKDVGVKYKGTRHPKQNHRRRRPGEVQPPTLSIMKEHTFTPSKRFIAWREAERRESERKSAQEHLRESQLVSVSSSLALDSLESIQAYARNLVEKGFLPCERYTEESIKNLRPSGRFLFVSSILAELKATKQKPEDERAQLLEDWKNYLPNKTQELHGEKSGGKQEVETKHEVAVKDEVVQENGVNAEVKVKSDVPDGRKETDSMVESSK
ncbi:hypothetical protein DFH11DRAFT_1577743 [Phellopilus nigrolimitatus]|nr:hypothetical protein DFH11DRAFT_1577743 [Phellopilus nigrolimitatus]